MVYTQEFKLAEHHLYGSSRLGIKYADTTLVRREFTINGFDSLGNFVLDDVLDSTHLLLDTNNFYRTLALKQYELNSHTQNVLATILDRKTPVGTNNITRYTADVVSAELTYPFHSAMPGKTFTAPNTTEYRFGASNGQEKDNEIAKGVFTAEYWEYDSRLGRRWNVDPKPNPSISNYATFANNPIWATDVNGDTTRIFDKRGRFLGQIDDSKENQVHFMHKYAYNKILSQSKGLTKDAIAQKVRDNSDAFYGIATERQMKNIVNQAIKDEKEHTGALAFIPGTRELEYLDCKSCYAEAERAREGNTTIEFKDRKLFAKAHTHWQDWDHAWRPSSPQRSDHVPYGHPYDDGTAQDYRPILNRKGFLGIFGGHPGLIIHRHGITMYPTFMYFGDEGTPKYGIDNENYLNESTVIPYSK